MTGGPGDVSALFQDLQEIIERHLAPGTERAADLAELIISAGLLNGYQVYSKSQDLAALARLDAAVVEVSRSLSDVALSGLARETLAASLIHGRQFDDLTLSPDSGAYEELRCYQNSIGSIDARSLFHVEEEHVRLRAAIKRTVSRINSSRLHASSRMNADAVGLVDACRTVWQKVKGRPAPTKDLNPASAFADFLRDVLAVAGLDADARSALKAWARERDRVHRLQD